MDSVQVMHIEGIEDEVLCEKDLVEAQVSWDIGETLGLKVNNKKVMIEVLAKVQDCQDFVIPRRRGPPKKGKICTRR